MLGLDELEDLRAVADQLEKLRTRGVGRKRCHPLLHDTVAKQRREHVAPDLAIDLVLAAGHGHDHAGVPAHRPVEGEIGRRVAGMQRDDKVGAGRPVVSRDVADLETQALVAKPAGECRAFPDHVLLEVETERGDLQPLDVAQIVVDGKGEIRATRTEVDHLDGTVAGQIGNDVGDQLQEAVDLAELVVALRLHVPFRVHDAELDEERVRAALLEHVPLPAIVHGLGCRPRRRPAEHLLAAEYLEVGFLRVQERLAILAEQVAETRLGLDRRQVLVRRPVPVFGGELKAQTASQLHRANGHPPRARRCRAASRARLA